MGIPSVNEQKTPTKPENSGLVFNYCDRCKTEQCQYCGCCLKDECVKLPQCTGGWNCDPCNSEEMRNQREEFLKQQQQ